MKSLRRPDRFPLSSNYDPDWVLGLDMGPHPLWQLEDLMAHLQVQPGDRVLDLGCGRGATSVFLAREFDLQVVAVDRWVVESALGTDRTCHRCDAWMQPGSRDDWVIWARAAGESDNSPLLTMLTSVAPDDIGFALVTAVKTPARADPSPAL